MTPADSGRAPSATALFWDLAIALVLLVLAQAYLTSNLNPFEKNWNRDTFYQKYYGTVVMSTCDRGFVRPGRPKIPSLEAFLSLKTDTFSCSDLPEDLSHIPPQYNAVNNYYLARSVELAWRLNGKISWTGLKSLLSLFCALTVAASYLVFRFGMGRLLAIVGTFCYFPLHLIMVPNLRQYAKMPFLMICFVLLGAMVHGPLVRSRVYLLSMTAGITVGIGLGFRRDILIVVIPVITTIIFFLPGGLAKNIRMKAIAVFLFLISFVVTYAPMLPLERTVHSNSHVTVAGLGNLCTNHLRVVDSNYEWAHVFSDAWTQYQIESYAHFEKGANETIKLYSTEYNWLGWQLLFDIVKKFPADILTRTYAAVRQIVKMPIVFGILLLLISTFSQRKAVFLFSNLLFLTGYTGAQFIPNKNGLHLQFVPLWLFGMGLHLIFLMLHRAFTVSRTDGPLVLWEHFTAWWKVSAKRLIVNALSASLLLAVPLWSIRKYQAVRVSDLLEEYDEAQLTPLSSKAVRLSDHLVRLEVDGLLEPLPTELTRYQVSVGYLVVEASNKDCGRDSVGFTLRYEPGPKRDFSRTAELDLSENHTTKIFAPIYSREHSAYGTSPFLGVEIAPNDLACIKLFRVADLHRFPPIVYITLQDDWRNHTLYQTFAKVSGWEELKRTYDLEISIRWQKIQSRFDQVWSSPHSARDQKLQTIPGRSSTPEMKRSTKVRFASADYFAIGIHTKRKSPDFRRREDHSGLNKTGVIMR